MYRSEIRRKGREERLYKWNYHSNYFFSRHLIVPLYEEGESERASARAQEKREKRVSILCSTIVIPYDLYCSSPFFFNHVDELSFILLFQSKRSPVGKTVTS